MITVTEKASQQIRKLLAQQHPDASGLRVGVKAGGCSGFEYVFAWEPAPKDTDLIFEGADGARVWTDPRSHRMLDGRSDVWDGGARPGPCQRHGGRRGQQQPDPPDDGRVQRRKQRRVITNRPQREGDDGPLHDVVEHDGDGNENSPGLAALVAGHGG